jgi:predicted ferric reductase
MKDNATSAEWADIPIEEWPTMLTDLRWADERSRDALWRDGHFTYADPPVRERPPAPRPQADPATTGTLPRPHAGSATTGTLPRPPAPRPQVESTATGTLPRVRTAGPLEQAPWSRPTAAAADRAGGTFFVILFWFTLATSLELWWLDTPAKSLGTTADVWLAFGRITGIVGGFILLLQILLMSRVGWLERWVGAHDLLIWHRELGGYLLIAILVHVAATIVGYAGLVQAPLLTEAWSMIKSTSDMIMATAATVLLVLIALLAIRTVRRLMSYEMWYYVHVTSYAVVVLGYFHQFSAGQEFMTPGFSRWFWMGLYVFVGVCLVWGRVIGPLALNLRHRLRVVDVVPEAQDMVSIYIGGRELEKLKARAGQYFRWRFLTSGRWWQAHPFSLSAAPNSEWLRLTVKVVGDHTEGLQYLDRGVRVFAEGPSGVFTADRSVRRKALLIAGGSGVAPIRAILEDLPRGTIMIYRARADEEIIFRNEFEWLARARGAFIWYVVGSRDDPGPKHLFTPRGLRELVPDVTRRDIFLCGPPGLVEASKATLKQLHVRKRQIHLDPFEF